MIERKFVRLSEVERCAAQKELVRLQRQPLRALLVLPYLAILGGLKAVLEYGAFRSCDSFELGVVLFVLGTLIAAFAANFYVREQNFVRAQIARIKADLKNDKSELIVASATRAIAVRGAEPSAFMDVGDGQILYLSGNYIWLKPTGKPRFTRADNLTRADSLNLGAPGKDYLPNTECAVAMLPLSGIMLAVRCSGHYLEPEAVLLPGKIRGRLPVNGIVFRGELSEIQSAAWTVNKSVLMTS